MRNAFAQEIVELAAADERLVLLSGDIGNRLFNRFREQFPKRFYNCGVAEQNMTGVAAGLAMCGLRPVTYTIAAFNTLRCLEQIRVDICYQNLPVVIVGVGGGLSYSSLNATHHALEDAACLRSLPNISVVCPGDAMEVRAAVRAALRHDGPVYIRLGKKNEPLVHEDVPAFAIGVGIVVREGTDVCILSSGTMLAAAAETRQILSLKGISAQVVSMHTVKPLDEAMLEMVFERFELVVTLEEHSVVGGFGSAVAEWLCDKGQSNGRLLRLGTPDEFIYKAGGRDYRLAGAGLEPRQISDRIAKVLESKFINISSRGCYGYNRRSGAGEDRQAVSP